MRGVARLGAAMGKYAVIQNRRVDRMGDQQRAGDDEAIHHDQHARLGSSQTGADHGGDLETAELGECFQRRKLATGHACRSLRQQHAFAHEAGIVQAGATADHLVQRAAGDEVGQQAGGGGVADAHLAEADGVAAARMPAAHEFRALGDGCVALGGRHRRLLKIVVGAQPLFGEDVFHAGARLSWNIARHAAVDDRQFQRGLARQHVDRRAPGEEVQHHLRRDFLRIGRHTGLRCAVVARKHCDAWRAQVRAEALLDQAKLQRDVLKLAKAAHRLGAGVEALLEGGREFAGEGWDVECNGHDGSGRV